MVRIPFFLIKLKTSIGKKLLKLVGKVSKKLVNSIKTLIVVQ